METQETALRKTQYMYKPLAMRIHKTIQQTMMEEQY